MTFSRKAAVRQMEAELHMFWRVMFDMKAMHRAGVPPSAPEMIDARDEIEVLEAHSDWPRLKRACCVVLAVALPVEALARELAVMPL